MNVIPTAFPTAIHVCGSSGDGTNDKQIADPATHSPMVAIARAIHVPPGTRITSIPAGRLCSFNMDANRNIYGMK